MPRYHSLLVSILAGARTAATAEERDRLFALAEMCSKMARDPAARANPDYQRQLDEILADAKRARPEEQRTAIQRAEECSERARGRSTWTRRGVFG